MQVRCGASALTARITHCGRSSLVQQHTSHVLVALWHQSFSSSSFCAQGVERVLDCSERTLLLCRHICALSRDGHCSLVKHMTIVSGTVLPQDVFVLYIQSHDSSHCMGQIQDAIANPSPICRWSCNTQKVALARGDHMTGMPQA